MEMANFRFESMQSIYEKSTYLRKPLFPFIILH